jgi:cytochrome c biogenesis protein CcdA
LDVLAEVLPLALLDTLSVSTLAVPLWFLLTPRGLRVGNVFAYLAIVATGYLLVGCALLAGRSALRDDLRAAVESPVGEAVVVALGVALVLTGLWVGLRRHEAPTGDGCLTRWRDSAVGESATARGLLAVALVAVLLELPTMLPYLLAIDTLGDSALDTAARVGVLAVYCLVMVAPAALLTVLRGMSGQALLPVLGRVNDWSRRGQREDTAWLLGIVGVLLLSTTGVFAGGMELLDRW